MMEVAVTQRVDTVERYSERRDALDQRWTNLLFKCGLKPFLVPNNTEYAAMLLKRKEISGLILTGGNSLSQYGGKAPERDKIEIMLLEYSLKNKLPVLGVCRGMQLIQYYFGVELKHVKGHVSTRLRLNVSRESRLYEDLIKLKTVNAYHSLAGTDSVPELIISTKSKDGYVMSIEHTKFPIYGQMWHSERENPPIKEEIDIIKKIFF